MNYLISIIILLQFRTAFSQYIESLQYFFDKFNVKQQYNPYYYHQHQRWQKHKQQECYMSDGLGCFMKYPKLSKFKQNLNET